MFLRSSLYRSIVMPMKFSVPVTAPGAVAGAVAGAVVSPQPTGQGCARVLDRRAFLQQTALAVAAALVAAGVRPSEAFAQQVGWMTPVEAVGGERTYEIPPEDGVALDGGSEVALARWQGHLFAFSLACPHRGATLQWKASEGQFYCPKHKARFTPDGTHASGRATRALDRFALRRVGDRVVIQTGAPLEATKHAAAWQAAVLTV